MQRKKLLVRLSDRFIGKPSELPLEFRFFNILAITGIIYSALATIINLLLCLEHIAIITTLVIAIFSLLLYIVTSKTKKYTLSTKIVFSTLILLFLPAMWFFNGGTYGTIPMFFILISAMIAICLSSVSKQIGIIMLGFILTALLIIEYKLPITIVPYVSESVRLIDFGVSLILVCVGIFIMISMILREYNSTINELKNTQKELHQANILLEVTSNTDELSGIFNRRYIMNKLQYLIGKHDISVIMIDIDYFKKVNDSYGHSEGDKVIKVVTKVLAENIRNTDSIGRIGGEEFLILLPNVSYEDAYQRAEIIRTKVSEIKWDFANEPITISGGVHSVKENESIENILENVDKCLYKAKDSGRNIIIGDL